MLDDYIKKIENIITPNHYDRNNYKEKILSGRDDNFEQDEKEYKLKFIRKPKIEKKEKRSSKEYEKRNEIEKKRQENEGK